MTTIDAKLVRELRDQTGAGMMDCKRALAECGGDMEKATDHLRTRGQAIADKKASRKASEGLVHCLITEDGRLGVILELKCETDFVARNDGFKALLSRLSEQIAAGGPGTTSNNVEEFLGAPDPKNESQTMQDVLRESIAVLAENIELGGFCRIEVGGENGCLHAYIHPPGKLGVIVELETGKPETRNAEAFGTYCEDLAMHISWSDPIALERSGVPAELVEKEKKIFRDQALNEGKPEKILDKIVEGKIGKFYKQKCLLEQVFVKDSDLTIEQLTRKVAQELDDEIKVVRYERMQVGD